MQKRILKNLVIVTLVSSVTNAYAVLPGFYLGLMAGPAVNGGGSQQVQTDNVPPTTVTATPKSTQFGTRVYMGYKINEYAGIEGGLTYFSEVKYKTPEGTEPCGSAKARANAFDVVGRGSVPISSVEVFGKAGVAVVYQTSSGPLNPNLAAECGDSKNTVGYRPTVSAGVSYNLSQSTVADISWTRVMVGGPINTFDFYALGISYHFVDIYCGQFLC